MEKTNSMQRILKTLKRYKRGRTKQQIMQATGVLNVGGRILDLRKQGHTIETIMEKGRNRYGEIVRYARYRMAHD